MSDRFGGASAAGYDSGFGSISSQFIPALLRAARVGSGYKVLDVATGNCGRSCHQGDRPVRLSCCYRPVTSNAGKSVRTSSAEAERLLCCRRWPIT